MDGVVGFGILHVGEGGELAYGFGDIGREGEEVSLAHVAGASTGRPLKAGMERRRGAEPVRGMRVLYLGDTEGCEGAVDGGNAG